MRASRILRLAVALLLLCGVCLVPGTTAPAAQLPAPAKRLLVIVPHPDDASLGGTAMIEQTLASGGSVFLAVVTNGDGFRLAAAKAFGIRHPQAQDLYRLGLLRQREELAAAKRLGVAARDVQFLGYPDGGMHQLWSNNHWTKHSPYRALNGYDHVPYENAPHPNAPYCGQAVVADLREVFARFDPTDVLYPDAHDIHNDHWATSAFTQYVLGEMRHPPRAWTYLIHYPDFPVPRHYRPQHKLLPPHSLTGNGMTWLQLPLSASMVDVKKEAILSHQSQIRVMSDFLLSFVRTNDLIGRHAPPLIRNRPAGEQPFAQAGCTLHHIVMRDLLGKMRRYTDPAADIRKIAAVRSGDRLQICLETAGPISPDLDYAVHLRLPDLPPARLKRLDFHIRHAKVSGDQQYLHLPASQAPTVAIMPNRLLLTLPGSLFEQAHTLLICAETSDTRHSLDKTAWQTLHLEAAPRS